MKKLLISVVALSISAMTMATQTASVRINLVGSNATYSTKTLRLVEDDARSAAAENGYDAECMMTQSNANSTLIYGLIGTTGYSTVATNDLTGLEIGFVTNQVDQDYTLTFTNFSGNEFTLRDKVTDQYITVNATTPAYAFSVTAAQVGRVAINDRFVIENAPAPAVKGICFNYNILTLTKYNGAKVDVYAQGATAAADSKTIASDAATDFDLNALASGEYVVKIDLDGDATIDEEYRITVKPAVTAVP